VWLKYSEEDIWSMTPRKFKAQLDVHQDVQNQMNGGTSAREQKAFQKAYNKQNRKVSTGFIDQIPNW
jgi:hypothetical protein